MCIVSGGKEEQRKGRKGREKNDRKIKGPASDVHTVNGLDNCSVDGLLLQRCMLWYAPRSQERCHDERRCSSLPRTRQGRGKVNPMHPPDVAPPLVHFDQSPCLCMQMEWQASHRSEPFPIQYIDFGIELLPLYPIR